MSSARQLERWAKMRRLGRTRFVIYYGVLAWGVGTGVFVSILLGWLQGWNDFGMWLAISMVSFPIGGIFWAMAMWMFFERIWRDAGERALQQDGDR
jgi:hypothetical protein